MPFVLFGALRVPRTRAQLILDLDAAHGDDPDFVRTCLAEVDVMFEGGRLPLIVIGAPSAEGHSCTTIAPVAPAGTA